MAKHDIERVDLPALDWSDSRRALTTVFDHAVQHSRRAEEWYLGKRGSKRVFGRLLRACSILLVGVAAVIPILAELWTRAGAPEIAPGWASVALILAATLVALDRYFGFSSAWTRFMIATITIAKIRTDFEYEWERAQVPGEGPAPGEMLDRAHRFVQAVDDTVADETTSWSVEFQSNLEAATRELDRARAQAG